MRWTGYVMVLLAFTAGPALGQNYIVDFRAASKEYGGSGSWEWEELKEGGNDSRLTLVPRFGVPVWGPVTVELEGMYDRRFTDTTPTSNAQTLYSASVIANALLNLGVTERTTAFVLVGYGSRKWWGDQPATAPDGIKNILQYGGGLRYFLTANAALRVEYRLQSQSKTTPDEFSPDRAMLLIGISIME